MAESGQFRAVRFPGNMRLMLALALAMLILPPAAQAAAQVTQTCDESLGLGRVALDGEDCVILDTILVKVVPGQTVDSAAQQAEQEFPAWTVTERFYGLHSLVMQHSPDNLTLSELDAVISRVGSRSWVQSAGRDLLVSAADDTGGGGDIAEGNGGTGSAGGNGGNGQTGVTDSVDAQSPRASEVFDDVSAGAWYESAVSWMILHEVTSGCTPVAFCPDRTLTRQQFVTFLWRAAGRPAPDSAGSATFGDVTEGVYSDQAIGWAVAEGITRGCTPGDVEGADWSFCPQQSVTRGQMATLLYRHVQSPYTGQSSVYADIEPHSYYSTPVAWLTDFQVVPGCEAALFCPNRDATRAEAALFINAVAIRPHLWGPGGSPFIS